MAKTRLKTIMALLLSSILLVACAGDKNSPVISTPGDTPTEVETGQNNEQTQTPTDNVETPDVQNNEGQPAFSLETLFPYVKNNHRIYEGEGGEYVGYEEYVDFVDADRIQLRMNNGGTEIVRVIERKDGELREIFSEAEIYYVENFLAKKPKTTKILIKEPLVVGNSWVNSEVETSTITSLDATVTTPLGTYKALEITRVSKNDGITYTTMDYYAPEVGLVKTVNEGGGYTTEASLKLNDKDATQKKVMNFYYPNIDDDRLFLYRKEISFKTNDVPRNLFLAAYKELPKEGGPVLTPNTKVNYLYLNDDGMVYIDLSKDFMKEMNAGAGYESLILQSLANTFGDYYGASKVMLTIEGEPYESGHIVFNKFEPIEVNYKSILNMN